jgi:hypothetical protein
MSSYQFEIINPIGDVGCRFFDELIPSLVCIGGSDLQPIVFIVRLSCLIGDLYVFDETVLD